MAKVQQNAAKVEKAPKSTNNPYRVGGGYWATVEALRTLGMGKMHDHDAILSAVRKAMGDGWKAFAGKDAHSDQNAKNAEGRAWQNVAVTARKDYGEPLRKVGLEVRFDGRAKVAGLFKVGSPVLAKAAAPKSKAAAPKSKAAAPKSKAAGRKSAEDAVIEAFGIDLAKGTFNPKKATVASKPQTKGKGGKAQKAKATAK